MSAEPIIRGIATPVAISYSLLASLVRHIPLDEAVAKMELLGVSAIHYDIADEVVTLPASLSHDLRKHSKINFDYHIAEIDPRNSIKNVSLLEGDFICAHLESKVDWSQIHARARNSGSSFGIGLNVGSEWSALLPLIESHNPDFALIMAAQAGRSGGSFDYKTLEKIHKLKNNYPNLRLHVDGGIDDLAAAALKGLGVELLVSGSYIHSGSEEKERLAFLRGRPDNPKLSSLRMKISPVVGLDSSWDEIIKFIDRGGIGCAIVISEDGFYQGIITNHDMRVAVDRTGLTKELTAIDIYNAKSFTSDPEEDFWTFMLRMQQKGAMHTVVPLVSKDLVFHGIVRTQDALFKNANVGDN